MLPKKRGGSTKSEPVKDKKSKRETKGVRGGDEGDKDSGLAESLEEELTFVEDEQSSSEVLQQRRSPRKKVREDNGDDEESRFTGQPIPADEARRRWPLRYQDDRNGRRNVPSSKSSKGVAEEQEVIPARKHFKEALIDGKQLIKLGEHAHVLAGEGQDHYICRVVEMFESTDGSPYFTAQWFYRAKDTVMKQCGDLIDKKRVFLSQIKDDNPLDCLIETLTIIRLPLDIDSSVKDARVIECDYYYDMLYLVPYSSFIALPADDEVDENECNSTVSSESDGNEVNVFELKEQKGHEMRMLDLYSGCGAMSTGVCLGAKIGDVNLVTKWAVDLNEYACISLKLNHPETEVRNESAEDFLALLKVWERLCTKFSLYGNGNLDTACPVLVEEEEEEEEDDDDDIVDDEEIFEVEKVLAICYGVPKDAKKRGLYVKIRWKRYGPEEDTWEPMDNMGGCPDKIKEFVVNGYKSKLLPLPGQVDVICGGPPCQGISGFNRFRKADNPLADEKNKQLLVYMEIVDFLKPRFVLMENVVDMLKFSKGFLGRHALAHLVSMNYQARIGLMAAGAYGLPQFRMRMFMWGACPTEALPQYPLPTHDVVVRGHVPVEFESNAVAYEDGQEAQLEAKLFLEDAISDLPAVGNDEKRDEMSYGSVPRTEFQKFIRLKKEVLLGLSTMESEPLVPVLYDHRPLQLNVDDYERVCQIPKKKGANFRDLKGVRVRDDNYVEWDPDVPRVLLPSGKPLVPDYAMTFVDGRSLKPFGRLWWDETVPTVVTRAEPHNQPILHPEQDRVLTIRENARLQGFPDYYKLHGPIKQRYMQVGNAVAVPVARALGYALAKACKGNVGEEPVFKLLKKFPMVQDSVTPSVAPSPDGED